MAAAFVSTPSVVLWLGESSSRFCAASFLADGEKDRSFAGGSQVWGAVIVFVLPGLGRSVETADFCSEIPKLQAALSRDINRLLSGKISLSLR